MVFRDKLLATLRAMQPVLEEPGVLVVGSEIPNLLERGAASTLIVSQDVDVGVTVTAHAAVKQRLRRVKELRPSADEPSVWIPARPGLLEVNFVGIDPAILDASESYVVEDPELPLMVFGPLTHLRAARNIEVEGLSIPVPRTAGLMIEKLITERSGEKGDRDLLVVLGLLLTATEEDLTELEHSYRALPEHLRYAVRSNLSILSLLPSSEGMPDAPVHRSQIAALIRMLERHEKEDA